MGRAPRDQATLRLGRPASGDFCYPFFAIGEDLSLAYPISRSAIALVYMFPGKPIG